VSYYVFYLVSYTFAVIKYIFNPFSLKRLRNKGRHDFIRQVLADAKENSKLQL